MNSIKQAQTAQATEFQFPTSFSYEKSVGLIGNSIHVGVARYFFLEMTCPSINSPPPNNIRFVDLFCGIGGFHVTLTGFGQCVLANDNNKDCQVVYQLNFPKTPFLLGDINSKEIQQRIIETDFHLLCAGFPCQPYSKANTSKNKKDTVISSLLAIINQKRPQCLFLENVPQLVKYPIWTEIKQKLEQWGYQIYWQKLCPSDFGTPMKRPRIFIWAQKNYV